MRFPLNLLTVALLGVSGTVVAADFGVSRANTDKVNTAGFQCRQCQLTPGLAGEATVNAGYNDSDDIHSGNAFGDDHDGIVASVDAALGYRTENGYRSQLRAHNLGQDNGFVSLKSGRPGKYQMTLDYRSLTRYENGNVGTGLWHNQGMLQPDDTQRYLDLELERQQAGIGFRYDFGQLAQIGDLSSYVRYDREEKQGHRSASLMTPRPVNFALPVDESNDKLRAGLQLSGDNWFTELAYQGSQYKNDINNLSLPYASDIYSAAPDNQAHQLTLNGQYRLSNTVISGRAIAGRMIQDEGLIQMTGNPLQSWDGQVDTLDANLAVSTLVNSRLRLGGQLDYRKRDNDSTVAEFVQLEFNPVSGAIRQNPLLDSERQALKLNASYRLAPGYRLQTGYDFKQLDRSYGEREETRDHNLWAKLGMQLFTPLKLDLKASFGERDGSRYEAAELTSSETQSLLRKYHLADRRRTAMELGLQYTPLSWMTLDLNSHYAFDDYQETVIGLTESRDYGYDLNLTMQLSKQLSVYGFVGQQWIASKQSGDQSATWYGDIDDSFINLGAGIAYSGLLDDRLTLGADYQFADSEGETCIGSAQYDDYYSFNHSVELYGRYHLNDAMALKVSYRYERYFDTDGSDVGIDAVTGLTTLGVLNHNYNAHQLMFSFSYLLP
ncbi:MtrB/PioB family decaheme-associated outer membrane protein [Shewanella indica]|uniref:MtrB/PioB family decaheme-associated outer membrane protein n=1 Tax=Shewanella indica TaxID=768528 RepID=UPI00300698DB